MSTDTLENFSPEEEAHKYLKRFKKSWIKRFRVTRMEEIYEAVDLANFLIALNRTAEAIKLLNFVISQIQFNGNYNTWSPAGCGIILLSRILRTSNNNDYEKEINKIVENDIYAIDQKEEYYKNTIAEQDEIIERANSETQKWACNLLSRNLMNLTYFRTKITRIVLSTIL